jgi:hypothetical protein
MLGGCDFGGFDGEIEEDGECIGANVGDVCFGSDDVGWVRDDAGAIGILGFYGFGVDDGGMEDNGECVDATIEVCGFGANDGGWVVMVWVLELH